MLRFGFVLSVVFPCTIFMASADAQPDPRDPYAAKLGKASDDWKKTVQRMKLPAGVKADIWAAEPLVANIVAFYFDEKGRCYVAETFRLHRGVTDNRSHMNWLDEDLASRTVTDRIAMYRKYLKKDFGTYEVDHDRIRLVVDSQGTGYADKATVFADGFQTAAAGIGSGVIARNGKVWYTCIPDLWLLQDTKGAGRADVKKSLSTGYGVHVSFIGHDSHGLRFGPDGKLYFSIGDRGLHVESNGKTIDAPDTGSVLRCNPDGSELEIFATGLRNPQKLVFDDFGNLFTGDNNADGGDAARWVHLVEGGDSGWRIGYQYMPGLGPWNAEKLWEPKESGNTASYLLPPVAKIANGPSGCTYNPGVTLLPAQFDKHFFLCDFRGSGGGSGIHAFKLKPKGASFDLVDRQQFVWSVLATDCEFAPDGSFYVSDWVDGWGLTNKGRIFKIFAPDKLNDPAVAEVKKLFADGFAQRSNKELVSLLGHNDQRVRQAAQFALVEMKASSLLASVARSNNANQLARIHAIWGLGQLRAYSFLEVLTGVKDAEIRAQALKVLGQEKARITPITIQKGLQDDEPRVRFFAAMAAAKNGDARVIPDVLAMVRANKDADPYLRHAGVMALVGIGDKDAIKQAATDSSSSVRLASLLAMRRLEMPEIALFLNDADKQIVLEAARAIYDAPIPAALPALAQRVRDNFKDVPEPAIRRVLAANYRLGGKENAQALVMAATRSDVPTPLREQALKMLQAWEKPSGRDWVVGLWRPLPERPGADVAEVLRPALASLMTGPDKIRTEGAKLAAKHGMKEIGPALRELVTDKVRPAGVRIEALKALETLKDAQLEQTANGVLSDDDPRLRHQGRRIVLLKAPKADAVKALAKVLDNGAVVERQGALALLADLRVPEADAVLEHWLDQLLTKKAPAEIQLDILLAAGASKNPAIAKKLAGYEATRDAKNPMSVYRESMVGGDADNGRRIFLEKSEVSCLRCHKIDGVGGEVGPDLTGIGKKQKRDYLLESIVDPNKQIAKGYETVVITLQSGVIKAGILKSEDAKEVRIMTPEGQLLAIPKTDIEERSRGPSAMPGDLVQKLSRTELRDLVEFLAGLK